MKRALIVVLASALASAPGAWAQEAIPTAANAPDGGAPAAAPSDGPITIAKKSERDDRGPMPVGPCGGVAKSVDGGPPQPDKDPHGAVWAGVGTHGYREGGGAVCIPIGQNAAVNIAVDATNWGRR
jgi:hypothetical protein